MEIRLKKINSIVTTIVFLLIVFLIAISNFLIPSKAFSENENRELAQMPELSLKTIINGDFGSNYEDYISDQFVMRDSWISIKTYTEIAMQKKDINGVYLCDDNYLIEQHNPNDKTNPIDDKLADKNEGRMTDFINKYGKILGKEHVNAIIVPTAVMTLSDKLPAFAETYDQNSFIDKVKSDITDGQFVDVRDTLNGHKNEYIYYKTDHHWTTLGAFYAYEQWAKESGLVPLTKDDFDIEMVSDSFRGTIFSKLNFDFEDDSINLFKVKKDYGYKVSYEMSEDTSNTLYNMDKIETKDKYSVFLDGNHSIVQIDTNVNNGRKLLIVKDSFAHCFAPFAVNHFESTYMVDLRYYKMGISQLIEEKGITDILVLYNTIHFVTDTNSVFLTK